MKLVLAMMLVLSGVIPAAAARAGDADRHTICADGVPIAIRSDADRQPSMPDPADAVCGICTLALHVAEFGAPVVVQSAQQLKVAPAAMHLPSMTVVAQQARGPIILMAT